MSFRTFALICLASASLHATPILDPIFFRFHLGSNLTFLVPTSGFPETPREGYMVTGDFYGSFFAIDPDGDGVAEWHEEGVQQLTIISTNRSEFSDGYVPVYFSGSYFTFTFSEDRLSGTLDAPWIETLVESHPWHFSELSFSVNATAMVPERGSTSTVLLLSLVVATALARSRRNGRIGLLTDCHRGPMQ